MTESLVVSIMLEAMRMTTILAAPMLLAALITGLVISIFQAVTQIQEQTLAIIPKMAAMLGILECFSPGCLLKQPLTWPQSLPISPVTWEADPTRSFNYYFL